MPCILYHGSYKRTFAKEADCITALQETFGIRCTVLRPEEPGAPFNALDAKDKELPADYYASEEEREIAGMDGFRLDRRGYKIGVGKRNVAGWVTEHTASPRSVFRSKEGQEVAVVFIGD